MMRSIAPRVAPFAAMTTAQYQLSCHPPSQQAASDDKDKDWSVSFPTKLPKSLEELDLSALMPVGSTLSFGTITGLCVGVFTKKIGRVAAGVFGGVFVLFQIAHQRGYVDVKMDKIEADVMKLLDADGDGKVDEKDARQFLDSYVKHLTCDTKLSAGSFTVGFLYGLKKG